MSESGTVPPPQLPAFPPPFFPTVYVDGIASLARSPGGAKIYFVRYDPNIQGSGAWNPMPVGQMIIPYVGFAHMVIFFEQQLKLMVADKLVDAEVVRSLRAEAEQVTAAVMASQQGATKDAT
jgi:hypothetical protein